MSTIFGNLAKNMIPFSELIKQVADFAYVKEQLIAYQQLKLIDAGIDSNVDNLRTDRAIEQGNTAYSDFTMKEKESRGQPSGIVTLKHDGDFYKSMKVVVNNTFYKLEANFQKDNGHIYDNFTNSYSSSENFEDSILGLTKYDFDEWQKKVFIPELLKSYNIELKKAIKASR